MAYLFPYWFLLGSFALAALVERSRSSAPNKLGFGMLLLFLLMTLMIGLRFQVGGDYGAYQAMFEFASNTDLSSATRKGDPGYQFINWLVGQWDGKMWQVNLICAVIFSWGLARFCLTQPAPMLAALAAIPYLVVVVAMGYTRQAVAIGFIMAGLASLDRNGSIVRFIFYVAFATMFHRTAVIALPLAIAAGRRNHFLNLVAIAGAGFGLYSALVEESVDSLVEGYLDTRYASQGAGVRVAMSVLPALLILFAGRKLQLNDYQRRFWTLVALLSVACVPALFLGPSTTAVDRVALYLIPIQLVVLGRLIYLFRSEQLARLVVNIYSSTILFVWLNYAAHAFAWVPYRTVIAW